MKGLSNNILKDKYCQKKFIQIAKKFNITIPTVKKHFTNIYDKIGVDDRHHLIELCRNNFV
ncbi:MAG: response regulator transcription factor [Bacteroidetes bacterium]|nr:response regulator transcription factor [Bacteroidota bacterium]